MACMTSAKQVKFIKPMIIFPKPDAIIHDTATIDARFAVCAACDKYVPPMFGKSALCYAKSGCKKLHPPARAATCQLAKWDVSK